MSQSTLVEYAGRAESPDPVTELLRTSAHQLLYQAVGAEAEACVAGYEDQRLADGRFRVVRTGYQPERAIQTSRGPVRVRIPKVRSRDGAPVTVRSALVPSSVRTPTTLEAAVRWVYLKGVSTGEMGAALEVLVGPEAKGVSASTVSRFKRSWAQEYRAWREAPLYKDRWVYVWADGVAASGLSTPRSVPWW